MNKRRISIVTATRAEYGLLKNLLSEIKADDDLQLQLIVTGTHLAPEFGNTFQNIIDDGFSIDYKVDMQLSADTARAISNSMGLALIGFAEAFEQLKPDILVVLGDRYELIPIVSAANIANIPIAHLHGGELTEGSKDEIFRHATTKLSHLHFTSLAEYTQRVIQMGETPDRVFNVGAIGLDNIQANATMEKSELEKSLAIKFQPKNLLITYHPDTQDELSFSINAFNTLLQTLQQQENTLLIFTKANADAGGRTINKMIDNFVALHPHMAVAFDSLGRQRYLSCLKHVNGLVGNSSSGIYEAGAFNLGVINIGDRQKGRVRGNNVIDATAAELQSAFTTLYSTDFIASLKHCTNPYSQGNASHKIKEILKNYDLELVRRKEFYDIKP